MAAISATNPILQPGRALSGNALLQAAKGLVNAQTQGPLADLARQIASNNQNTAAAGKLAGGYFTTLGQQAQHGVDQSQQIASGLNQTLGQIGQGTQQAIQGAGHDAMQSFQRYAPQGEGAGLGTSAVGQLAQEIARQQGLAAQQSGNFQEYGAAQGANAAQLANSNLGTFALRGQEALKGIAQAGQLKNEPLDQKVADIRASQGSLLSTAVGKLRQQEIGNEIAKSGLLTKEQIAQLQSATSTANSERSVNAANARNTASINAAAARQAAALAAKGSKRAATVGPGGQLAGSKRDAIVNYINTARSTIRNYPGIPQQALAQLLTNGYLKVGNQTIKAPRIPGGQAGAIAQAALDLEQGGALTPTAVNALHQLGFMVNGQYPLSKSTAGNVAQGIANSLGTALAAVPH